ncbi:methyltransferase [Saccharopolyspora sp. SCSIO 74807]|uniref:methyltransferase n=1 Tax=Saccharopolyspora sp. SCSIO 74807 TaxID=3118084 RepID=UPI0030CF8DC9
MKIRETASPGDRESEQGSAATADAAAGRGQLLTLCYGYLASRMLHAAVRLRIPDALADEQLSVDELAAQTETRPDALHRLLRGLEHIGIVAEARPARFALTPTGDQLRCEGPVASMIELFCAEPVWRAWESLEQTVRTGQTGFAREFGVDFYDYCDRDPALASAVRDGLGQETLAVAPALADAVDFARFGTVVDVGGGNGALLNAVLARNPGIRGVLVDTAAGCGAAVFADAGQRCERVIGDFFGELPAGGDAYLLKSVIQDWADRPASQILRACRRAMRPHARLLLVENLGDARPPAESDVPLRDLILLTTSGGRVRTEPEFAELLARSGFRLVSATAVDRSYHVLEAAVADLPADPG